MIYLITLTISSKHPPFLYKYLNRCSQKYVAWYELVNHTLKDYPKHEYALELTKSETIHAHIVIDTDTRLETLAEHFFFECYNLLQPSFKTVYVAKKNRKYFSPNEALRDPNTIKTDTYIQYGYSIRIDLTDDNFSSVDYLNKTDKKSHQLTQIAYTRHLLNELWFASALDMKDLKDYFKQTSLLRASQALASLRALCNKVPNICYKNDLRI